jgi:serine/threonine protein phosphatase PrpC
METVPYHLLAAGGSDVGLVREANEDAWRQVPELNLFVLADGMGGHRAGDVASNEAVNRLCNIIKREVEALGSRLDLEEAQALVYDAIQEVNEQVHTLGQSRSQLLGMGTTLCALYFLGEWALLAHVGDSRIYRVRQGILKQMTADHSLFQELVDGGTLEAGEDFARKHIITKAIGVDPTVEPSLRLCEVRADDYFFLCSDGLTDLVSNEQLELLLADDPKPEELVARLIKVANEAGGVDNVTIVAILMEEQRNE